jgi:hypothetical protein
MAGWRFAGEDKRNFVTYSGYISRTLTYKKSHGNYPETQWCIPGSRPDEVDEFFFNFLPAALGLGFTQPRTEMSTKNRNIIFLVSRARPVRRADKLTAICEPNVYKMWDPSYLTTL